MADADFFMNLLRMTLKNMITLQKLVLVKEMIPQLEAYLSTVISKKYTR